MKRSKFILVIFLIISTNTFAQEKGELLGRSIECSQRKDYQCMVDNMTKLIPLEKNKKKLSLYHNNLGIAQLNTGKYADAINSFNKSIELDKKFYLPYYGRARTNEILENENTITSDLITFLDLYEKIKTKRHYKEKIYALIFLNKENELKSELLKANSEKEKIDIEIALIRIKKRNKLYEEAISDYLKLIEKYPDNPIIYNNLADTYLLNGQISQGLTAVDKSIELNSQYYTSFMTKAELLMSLDKIKESCEFLNKSIELGFNPTRIPDLMKKCKN